MEKTLRQHINEHPDVKAGKAIAIVWDTSDLLELETGPDQKAPINEREACEILEKLDRNHDADIGITWDVIENAISDYILENPRTITRADVAVGTSYGSGESGGWNYMQVDIPTHQLEGLTDQELVAAFEKAAILELDDRGEECVFVRTVAWEEIDPDEDDGESEE